jgi:iron complex outermembrane receptor protein
MPRSVRFGTSAALIVVLLAGSAAGQAQQPAEGLEEVVVTARKQAEAAQDVPVSVTVLTAEQIENLGLHGINDVALRTPGLQYGNFGDVKLSPISLRGVVASAGSAGTDPAVGMYVDEVFIGQGAGASLDLFDIERVEVLRGPQGTLFGRNTIGGVINITTKRPADSPDASVELEYGNFDQVRAGASVSGPLGSGGLAGKLAMIYDERSGTTDDAWLDTDTNSQRHWSTRGQLQFEVSEETELLLTAEYFDLDQSSLAFETLLYDEAGTLPQVLDMLGLPRNDDPFDRKIYSDDRNEETLELWGVAANFHTRLGEVGLTNILSYRSHEYFSRADTDRSPLTFLYDGDPEDVDRFSEELRLDWTTGSLAWILGAYYYQQDSTNLSFVEVGGDLATLLGAPEIAGLTSGSDAQLETRSVAGFGSLTWTLTEALDFTFGGRYTHETKDIDYVQSDPIDLLGGDFAVKANDSWSEFTPNASMRYHFMPSIMGYFTVSNGFKSGGFNDALGDANGIGFDPEELWNYEAGVKSELLDRRVIANLAVFHMDWKDIQITTDNPSTPIYDPTILNAGKAHSTGVEMELQALVTSQFRIDANLAIQEAEYDEGTLPTGEPLREIPFAPSYTGNLAAEYRIPVGGGEIFVAGEAAFRGESYLTADNHPDGRVSSYELYNARIGYRPESARWSITLWGSNLADEEVKQRLFDLSGLGIVAQKFIALNDPRTYGVTLRADF